MDIMIHSTKPKQRCGELRCKGISITNFVSGNTSTALNPTERTQTWI